MKHKITIILITIIMIVGLVACQADTAPEPTAVPEVEAVELTQDQILTLGEVSDEPAKIIGRDQPLADYLAAQLADHGIQAGEVKVAPDMGTMIAWMESGEVDIFFDSLYPSLLVHDATGAQPILRRWKDGVGEYHTVFFARADSGIASLEDLQGQLVALEELGSTSGYLLPLAYMVEAGLNPVEKGSLESSVPDDEIGYTFSGEDENTLQWVVAGEVSAGATDNNSFEEILEETDVELVVFHETESVARQVVLTSPTMASDMVDAIITLMVELDETEEGPEILDTFKTSQFDEFPGGIEPALERMQELLGLVQGN